MKNLIIIFITLLFVSCSEFKVSDISCKNDTENCPKDHFCNVEGKCVTDCKEDSECLGGFKCVEGKCKTSCENLNSNCKDEYFCVKNECKSCTDECSVNNPYCFFSVQKDTIACCEQEVTTIDLNICYLKCGASEKYSEYNQSCQKNCNENNQMEIFNPVTGDCECKEGFAGYECKNINECEEIPSVCNPNTNCEDKIIGEGNNILPYLCSCQDGFEEKGNNEKGIICGDIDECSTVSEKCSEFPVCCDINAFCDNIEGSFLCDCKVGYVWEENTCTASFCPNNIIESGEECDGIDLNNQTCLTLDYSAGMLGCDSCKFNTTDCRKTIQTGSADNDDIRVSYIDENGNIYIAFSSLGSVEGCENSIQNTGICVNSGGFDIYISKYNSNFQRQWVKKIGTSQNDFVSKIILYNDFIYISGNTAGEIPLNTSLGGTDIFIAKLDMNGNYIVGKQFGDENDNYSSDFLIKDDVIYIVNNIFIANKPTDANLNAVNLNDFNIITTTLISTSEADYIQALFIENSNIWITGYTTGNLEGTANYKDIFIVKYTFANNQFTTLLTKQFTTSTGSSYGIYDEEVLSVFVKDNLIYLSGYIMTDLSTVQNGKLKDILILVYDMTSSQMYYKQIIQIGQDSATQIFVDSENNIYIGGNIEGSLMGNTYIGGSDVFIAKYSFNSTLDGEKFQNTWSKQFGTASNDSLNKMIIKDKIYLFGNTLGVLDGNIQIGGTDIFITTYDLQ